MPLFYRGAGVGTYWHGRDAMASGFSAQNPAQPPTADMALRHIVNGTTDSPFISLTRSYEVACTCARTAGRAYPSPAAPAFVYEVELTARDRCRLLDPIRELAGSLSGPFDAVSYQHDGHPNLLVGLVDHAQRHLLGATVERPPPGGATPRPANVSFHLEALVRALRDAELLAVGHIPKDLVRRRIPIQ